MLGDKLPDKSSQQCHNDFVASGFAADFVDEYKTLKYDRDDLQHQLDDLQHYYKDLRDRYDESRADLESVRNDNRLLITQYDKLNDEYNSVVDKLEKC